MLFTRDDEHEMELLIEAESERPLSDGEKQRLRDIRNRYDVFIADGVQRLRTMAASQSPRPQRMPVIQLPRNACFFVQCGVLAVISLVSFVLSPVKVLDDEKLDSDATDLVRFVMMTHTSACLLSALIVLAMALRFLNRSFLQRALLTGIGIILGGLGTGCLVAYVYNSHRIHQENAEGNHPPTHQLVFLLIMDSLAFLLNAWLFMSHR